MTELCGDSSENFLEESLSHCYDTWHGTAEVSEKERKLKGYATSEDCKNYVLERIDSEIRRLKNFQKEYGLIERNQMEIEKLRQNVPDDPRAERLVRYEASLERAFDRTLTELERVQRMRKGQPIPPPLKLDISNS